jgi:PKD repeat protein
VATVVQGSAKAWVNFNGTGTVAIRAQFNVSSITDNGTGLYTVNFTTAMTDANYSWQFNGDGDTTGGGPGIYSLKDLVAPAAGSIQMQCRRINNILQDPVYVTVAIFR